MISVDDVLVTIIANTELTDKELHVNTDEGIDHDRVSQNG